MRDNLRKLNLFLSGSSQKGEVIRNFNINTFHIEDGKHNIGLDLSLVKKQQLFITDKREKCMFYLVITECPDLVFVLSWALSNYY